MSFDREIDKAFNQAAEGVEKGVASFGKNVLSPFFRSVGIGVKEVQQKQLWKTKEFARYMGIVTGITAITGITESVYLADLYPQNPVWNWVYHQQKYWPFPITGIIGAIGLSYFFYARGKKVSQLRQRFIVAFERCGLYSSRRVMVDNKSRPEYPGLFKEIQGDDGGITFVFRNVGIPVEAWQKEKSALEASIGEKISRIEMFNNKPSFIAVKLGGVEIPENVDFDEELISHCGDSSVAIGIGEQGVLTHDFKKNPHLLVGGATGAGKTVVANSIVYQCITKLDGMLYLDFKSPSP